MKDGLYRVEYKGVTAGFVLARGKMVQAAPIVRKNLWMVGLAVWLCACSNPRVEDWKVRTDTCAYKVRLHEAVIECRWRLGGG